MLTMILNITQHSTIWWRLDEIMMKISFHHLRHFYMSLHLRLFMIIPSIFLLLFSSCRFSCVYYIHANIIVDVKRVISKISKNREMMKVQTFVRWAIE